MIAIAFICIMNESQAVTCNATTKISASIFCFLFQLKYCAHDKNKTIKVWRETFAFLISCNVQHE